MEMFKRIRLPLISTTVLILLLFITKNNEELFSINKMFAIAFSGWLIAKIFNLKRLDQ